MERKMIDLNRLEEKSDHDLLIVSVTSLAALESQFANHLAHHQAEAEHRRSRELIYLTIGLGAIVTAVFSVVNSL